MNYLRIPLNSSLHQILTENIQEKLGFGNETVSYFITTYNHTQVLDGIRKNFMWSALPYRKELHFSKTHLRGSCFKMFPT